MESSSTTSVFERVTAALTSGSSARSRLGVFYVFVHPGYEGRNPRTGEVTRVPAKKSLAFVASDELATAAFPGKHEPFGEIDAEVRSTAAGAEIAPSVDVACSMEELDALAASLAKDSRAEIGRLGALVVRRLQSSDRYRIQLQSTPSALEAMNAR